MANNNADSLTSPKAPAISEGDMESRLPYASSVSPNESSNLLGPNIKLLQQDQRNVKRLKVILIVLLVIALVSVAVFVAVLFSMRESLAAPEKSASEQADTYWHGAVAAEVDICSEIGVNVMREQQGSAVDAAIAALLCTGVINNFSSGIGGGGFMLIRLRNGSAMTLDFREKAPLAAHRDMYAGLPRNASSFGVLSIAVPGEIKGFHEAHSRYGKCSWSDLFAPSIRLARDGFLVPKELARRIERFAADIRADPVLSNTWAPGGVPLKEGELLKRPALARTLESISLHGADEFYTGALAKQMVDFIQQKNGLLTLEDFEDYEALWKESIEGTYRGFQVQSVAAPASGAVLIQALNILEGYDLAHEGNTPLNAHRFIETLKHVYASRILLGDPQFPNVTDMATFEQKMISKDHAKALRDSIQDEHTYPWRHYINGSDFDPIRDHGTTHVSVMDEDGMSVAATSTVNLEFGSKVMDETTGILFNDEMDDFAVEKRSNEFQLPPGPNNYIQPGKRPFSSSTPVIVSNATTGKVQCVVGAAGGSRIISATLQTLVGLLDYHMSVQDAVQAPRIHHQLLPNKVTMEHLVPFRIEKELLLKGHRVKRLAEGAFLTSVQAVYQSPLGWKQAASDARKGGLAKGY